jgi:hypothetical protein
MPLRPATDFSIVLRAPTYLPDAVIQVPVQDPDGNAIGGVRLPDMVAPAGTHAVQNPPMSFFCSLVAGYMPFAATREEREKASDARLSLEERYKDRDDYVTRIRVAARDLGRRHLLLSDDVAVMLQDFAATNVLK